MKPRRSFAHVQRPEAFVVKFRSKLEHRYACYLQALLACGQIASWSYETETFWFDPASRGARERGLAGVKRGVTSYKPDFKIVHLIKRETATTATIVLGGYPIEWHEVKGFMDARSRTALKRMAKYYPNEKVVLVTAADVKRLGF